MTITLTAPTSTAAATAGGFDFQMVVHDLYRDIHKGIRAELFALTSTAGAIDPSNRCDRAAVADHVAAVAGILDSHAHHEDAAIGPALEANLPDLAEQIAADHTLLDARFAFVTELAASTVDLDRGGDARRLGHLLYLELGGFVSAYLGHQIVEERVVMPALEQAIGVEEVIALHMQILGSIPPEEMVAGLSMMLPALNLDDRAEMLGGMRLGAPPEAFQGVVGLARSVLRPADFDALATRLELG